LIFHAEHIAVEVPMEKMQKEALQVAKEIMVKFIETGRVSPNNFGEMFPAVYNVVFETICAGSSQPQRESAE
jgi:hypothetical protein